ncbi:hypothetical protein CspeluHIS016_0403250 [Cutaneotrichosporon spelunceum]|uniref:Uncharacterized protein n=1 Tax=Cutaneotrichosporon spelunceum TaxID=1672016 RepID=A0AAD3TV74_9TREE|nr:hypothetical protein CspeluHIS016_0403250 [Cutaneotrichosporon spelunceum]
MRSRLLVTYWLAIAGLQGNATFLYHLTVQPPQRHSETAAHLKSANQTQARNPPRPPQPRQPRRRPVQCRRRPVQLLRHPVQLLHHPVQLLHHPVQLLHHPVQLLHHPVQLLHHPVQLLHHPVQLLHHPVQLPWRPVQFLCRPAQPRQRPAKPPRPQVQLPRPPASIPPSLRPPRTNKGNNSRVSLRLHLLVLPMSAARLHPRSLRQYLLFSLFRSHPLLSYPSAGPASGAPVAPQDTSLGPPASNTAVSTGTGPAAATAATPVTGSDSASASPLSSPPAGSPNAVVSSDSSAAFAPAATTIGGANSECTTSNGLKGKVGPGGCFANAGQDCVVSQGIQGVTSDTGTCAPIASVGASCTLSDGTKGTAQLQGLGTSLSCIGESLPVGGACPLPFNVIGTLSSDGRTCTPPKEAPPAGGACPVPGLSGLGVMQPDGKTCLPPTPPTTSSSGGGGGVGLTNGAGCAIDGQPGSIDNGGCRALVSRAGDPCYRNGAGAFFSNAPPDGILDSDLTTCMVVNDTCNVNGVQGRWSPSYVCSNPPPVSGNPASDGDVCQRSHMWGGRWDAANSTCILPGDPCPTGIYGPNAKDCIAKPPAGSGCQTSQGFNGTFNDAGLCVATIPPGERTPCISVKSTAGTISITPNGTLCQIAPTPDTPQGLLQDILSGSYCSNGKDAGMFNDIIECEVVQRPGGLSAVPDGTPGNPRNDISSLQSVTPHTNNNSWLPGVIAACVVVGVALILGILAWKCGWFRLCTRKRRQHEPFGEGEGVLDETTYGPQPTFPTVSGQYRDYNPPMTSSPPTTTNRQSVVSDPYSDYNNGLNRQHHENSLSMVSDGFSTTDPFSDASNNESHTGWNQGHLSQYSHTNAGSVSADSGSQPIVPLSPPGSPPMGQLSPPGSPGQHVVHQPLLSGYPADPPAYPAGEQGGSKSPYR